MTTPETMSARSHDWRNGAIVYQVFVDRFAPPANLEAKRYLYPAPMRLRTWDELPKSSAFDPKLKTYPHVLDFWGGDLKGVRGLLPYIKELGADVLYLNPIFKSPSNHKYDTEDYFQIDPQYGTEADFKSLLHDVHAERMKLVLDGVFNHIGATSKVFLDAKKSSKSSKRDWFSFGKEFKNGYLGWAGVASLPRLRVENPAVRDYLWRGENSVVRKYLAEGVDGWRLDVGFELGPTYLEELTHFAHLQKKGSLVVGEILGYPSHWYPAVDGVFNLFALSAGTEFIRGKIPGGRLGLIYDQMVADAGIENLLKSWLVTDNHDTDRLASLVPDQGQRKLVQALQFTLPGSPCIYYGSELGMTGRGDPADRAPMQWKSATNKNADLVWLRTLIPIRKRLPALRYGDYHSLATDQLLGFVRSTDKLHETVIVLVNPKPQPVQESIPSRVGRLMSWGELEDQVSGTRIRSVHGLLHVDVPAQSVMILTPVSDHKNGYSPYDRVD